MNARLEWRKKTLAYLPKYINLTAYHQRQIVRIHQEIERREERGERRVEVVAAAAYTTFCVPASPNQTTKRNDPSEPLGPVQLMNTPKTPK